LGVFPQIKAVKPDKKSEKIEMSSGKVEKPQNYFLETIKPLPYMESVMNKLMKSNNSSSLEKPQIMVKEIEESTLFKIPLDKELSQSPAYMKHYRAVREKVRAWASRNYYSRKKGEVIISFTLFASGKVGDIYFGAGSTKDKTLRNIALKSIEKSAPFPPFPEELKKYSPIRFNVSIIFQK
jgi:TonB family protein